VNRTLRGMSGNSVEFRRCFIYGAPRLANLAIRAVRLPPQGIQEGQEVGPAQLPVQVRNAALCR
jgi:hypothetical protein